MAFKSNIAKACQLRFADCKEVVLTHFPDLDLTGIEVLAIEKENAPPPIKDVAILKVSLASDFDP